jgi:hypothetical protein
MSLSECSEAESSRFVITNSKRGHKLGWVTKEEFSMILQGHGETLRQRDHRTFPANAPALARTVM